MKKDKFWNMVAKRYDDEVGEETTKLTKKYLRKDDTALDYGCARGAYTIALMKNMMWSWHSISCIS